MMMIFSVVDVAREVVVGREDEVVLLLFVVLVVDDGGDVGGPWTGLYFGVEGRLMGV